jgi:SAM-dependent methyltransferase
MSHAVFVITRLWRYFSLYFLKPFDAVNDTLTASLLRRCAWSDEIVEIGSGDGMYSFIMHGGTFPFWFDRYVLTDLSRADIYDTHRPDILPTPRRVTWPRVRLAIDAKFSHVEKIREIGFARAALRSQYESLPLASESVDAVFYYTAHGLVDHGRAVADAHRILKPGGRMFMLLFDAGFQRAFVAHRLAGRLRGRLGRYFERLDNGRFDEMMAIARTPEEWRRFFAVRGLRVLACHAGLSLTAWRVYDTQTRPLLQPLIRFFNAVPRPWRTALKAVWMAAWFPWLVLFYALFSQEWVGRGRPRCYLVWEVVKA